MTPYNSISSRYSSQNVNSILIGTKGSPDAGYVYMPYIVLQSSSIAYFTEEEKQKMLRDLRRKKIEKINKCQ